MNILQRCISAMVTAVLLATTVYPVFADEAADLTTEIQAMDANAATTGSGAVTGKIAADFESFAGSNENATALVTGLRNGSEITLTQDGEPSATFTPPTRPMGYGNVSTSLTLAKYQLAQQGITKPTPEQQMTALNGGTITVDGNTVEYQGVLQMRADGMGWGQIAQQLGTKLGYVVSGLKSQNAGMAATPASTRRTNASSAPASSAGTGSTQSRAGGHSHSHNHGNHGIVTGAGTGATGPADVNGKGKVSNAGGAATAPGRGIVSASGQAVGSGAQGVGRAQGHGAVTASGAAGGAAARGGGGNGKALGRYK